MLVSWHPGEMNMISLWVCLNSVLPLTTHHSPLLVIVNSLLSLSHTHVSLSWYFFIIHYMCNFWGTTCLWLELHCCQCNINQSLMHLALLLECCLMQWNTKTISCSGILYLNRLSVTSCANSHIETTIPYSSLNR